MSDEACPKCNGTGKEPGWPQPDSFGNYDPCDRCEGTGLLDFERDRPIAPPDSDRIPYGALEGDATPRMLK